MEFIKKWYNSIMYDTKGAVKSWFSIALIFITLATCAFVDSTFNVNLTEEYNNLSCVMEDNRNEIQELIKKYEQGSVIVKKNYCIYFTKDKVDVKCYKNINLFISDLQISYSVDKSENDFIISEKYTENDKMVIINSISIYVGVFVTLIFIAMLILQLIAFVLKKIIIINKKITIKK